MARPKGKINKDIEKKLKDYFSKIKDNDIKPSSKQSK